MVTATLVGLGSIGKRHLNNLESLGVPCENIRIVRTRQGTASFGDAVLAEHGDRHPVFDNLEEGLAGADIAVIANPTSLHLPAALAAVRAGCSVLIEKPLGTSLHGAERLGEEARRRGLVTCVGYNLRFHPLALRMKAELSRGIIGTVRSVETYMSERVTDWHPWEPHTVSYACRKELGGGVIGTQSHEVDLLHFFFGSPRSLYTEACVDESLPMDVANVAKSTLCYDGFSVRHLVSYLGPKRRFIRIEGDEGALHWNYYGETLVVQRVDAESQYIRTPEGFDLNDTFLAEMRAFLDARSGTGTAVNPLPEACTVLKTLLAMEESGASGRAIPL